MSSVSKRHTKKKVGNSNTNRHVPVDVASRSTGTHSPSSNEPASIASINQDYDNQEEERKEWGETSFDLTQTNWTESIPTFDEMNLNEDLLRGIYAYGFEKPSDVQAIAIGPLLEGRDTIVQAQSGTGKTGAFSIAMLQTIDPSLPYPQGLVLCHTRELAMQINDVLSTLAQRMNITVIGCIGGTSTADYRRQMNRGVHVIAGTPGRVIHMLEEGYLDLSRLRMLILDEVDVMLEGEFAEQVYKIFCRCPRNVQVGLFSATMPIATMHMANRMMRDPAVILIKENELTLEGIRQYYISLEDSRWKLSTLLDLYESVNVNLAIIFCNLRRSAEWLGKKLEENDFSVCVLHGELEMAERVAIMKSFRAGASRVLITTDVAARGIDVHGVSVVINFDIPMNRENYIHRIGRSGRYGKKGVAINFVTPRDIPMMRDIEGTYNTSIEELPMNFADYLV